MPLREGMFRERFDPDKDAGLPRPFLLDSQPIAPAMRHSLEQPKAPEKVSPRPKKPHMAPFVPPKFFTLPHADKRYKHMDLIHPGAHLVTLTKANIKELRKVWVLSGYGLGAWRSFIKGRDFRPGVYVTYLDPGQKFLNPRTGKIETAMVFARVPDQYQKFNNWTDMKALHAYSVYLWRHDRSMYYSFRDQFVVWKGKVIDAARKAYDDAVAKNQNWYAKAVADWENWARKYRAQVHGFHW